MENAIDRVFEDNNGMKIMTHLVAGYPDMETSTKLFLTMADCGVDLIEVQIPFTDPLADGPTIMRANQKALDQGVTPLKCFELVRQLKDMVDIPVLLMSYVNIPFRMGMQSFAARSAECGASGLIVPDVPYDEETGGYYRFAREYGLYPVCVLSPGMSHDRMEKVLKGAEGFVYITLRAGITGARKKIGPDGLEYLNLAGDCCRLPIAAGFGISSPGHIELLEGRADAAVIGSRAINILEHSGLNGVAEFLKSCRRTADKLRGNERR